ncbi:uncharacterized protein SCHCODRAFT_02181931 [Schizophyllum commune H4-8]|uniref:uncharacterized protein n=1 Tax=Schizophyllum commune (strain H4-8 / FGSC 9210) TaxID=578458 RepID=UPI0021601F48|nr:uncharacterized protein SCHCODRAFT_02181931 [Schizophyllum commune H4-8]KAI5896079.1 hypothetical protein SCHCODRAFT_02181931 [Schizophyllum commune H4-8]
MSTSPASASPAGFSSTFPSISTLISGTRNVVRPANSTDTSPARRSRRTLTQSTRRKSDARRRRPRHARGRLVNLPWRVEPHTYIARAYPTQRHDMSTVTRTRVTTFAAGFWRDRVSSPRADKARYFGSGSKPAEWR